MILTILSIVSYFVSIIIDMIIMIYNIDIFDIIENIDMRYRYFISICNMDIFSIYGFDTFWEMPPYLNVVKRGVYPLSPPTFFKSRDRGFLG